MITVHFRNVTHALAWARNYFMLLDAHGGHTIAPRGAKTIEAPEPVCTVYKQPRERVLLSASRDANPFFHFFEALWMLAGRRDTAFVSRMVERMGKFSDDGVNLWGAYGYRWRRHFEHDQLDEVCAMLRKDPDTRRAVLSMWDPRSDPERAAQGGRDVPCNTQAFFKVRNGALNMTVLNRSNDMIWGAYGANAVHMSMLQEYVADRVRVKVGVYRQVSDSLHVYVEGEGAAVWERLKLAGDRDFMDPYEYPDSRQPNSLIKPFPMHADAHGWENDLQRFMGRAYEDTPVERREFTTEFFQHVVTPMWLGYRSRNAEELANCAASDWRAAGLQWLARRGQR